MNVDFWLKNVVFRIAIVFNERCRRVSDIDRDTSRFTMYIIMHREAEGPFR